MDPDWYQLLPVGSIHAKMNHFKINEFSYKNIKGGWYLKNLLFFIFLGIPNQILTTYHDFMYDKF